MAASIPGAAFLPVLSSALFPHIGLSLLTSSRLLSVQDCQTVTRLSGGGPEPAIKLVPLHKVIRKRYAAYCKVGNKNP